MPTEGQSSGERQSANVCRTEGPCAVYAHLYMDIIGPLFDHGDYRYCLCLIDSHTRYPFAYTSSSATSKDVCQCLIDVFAQVGIPSKITSDQGTCFTAELTTKFLEMFGCSPVWSTPLHPEGNSLIERRNQTFEKTLAHVCKSQPREWHKHTFSVVEHQGVKKSNGWDQSIHDDYGLKSRKSPLTH